MRTKQNPLHIYIFPNTFQIIVLFFISQFIFKNFFPTHIFNPISKHPYPIVLPISSKSGTQSLSSLTDYGSKITGGVTTWAQVQLLNQPNGLVKFCPDQTFFIVYFFSPNLLPMKNKYIFCSDVYCVLLIAHMQFSNYKIYSEFLSNFNCIFI